MNKKGQALVEFVLILPVFMMIVFVIADFGILFSKKSTLENDSTDIIAMIKNDKTITDINQIYPDYQINMNNNNGYLDITITKEVNLITPGLNKIMGDPYLIIVERKVPDET